MAITKFKITRAPKLALLNVDGKIFELEKEYPISKQASMTATIYNLGEPYDEFFFKLGNQNGDWSPDIKCTINSNVDVGTPTLSTINIDIKLNEVNNVLSSFVFDNYTDRFRFTGFSGTQYGTLKINGNDIILYQTYMRKDLSYMEFHSSYFGDSQNVVTAMTIEPGNITEWGSSAIVNFNSSANLKGSVDSNSTNTGVL